MRKVTGDVKVAKGDKGSSIRTPKPAPHPTLPNGQVCTWYLGQNPAVETESCKPQMAVWRTTVGHCISITMILWGKALNMFGDGPAKYQSRRYDVGKIRYTLETSGDRMPAKNAVMQKSC